MNFKIKTTAFAIAVALTASGASAASITHSASDFGGTMSGAFGPVGDAVGTTFVAKGVDYTWGNIEGVFNDGVPAMCGINVAGNCDLVTDVDGQIVDTSSGLGSFTSFISIEGGYAAAGALTLSVYDATMTLIGSALNGLPNGPNGRTTMTIDHAGLFDIAYFRVSGADTYGVNTVTIEAPQQVAAVPLPAGLPLLLGALGGLAALRRRNKKA